MSACFCTIPGTFVNIHTNAHPKLRRTIDVKLVRVGTKAEAAALRALQIGLRSLGQAQAVLAWKEKRSRKMGMEGKNVKGGAGDFEKGYTTNK